MIILAIETSCDETAASIVKMDPNAPSVLSNVISSQVALHSKWGGVVPNLAAREHLKNIMPVITESLKAAKISKNCIDILAVTAGPGLVPALLVGASAAKTLAYLWKKPLIGVHHIEGHIYANFTSNGITPEVRFPILCLVVSGGHTQLIMLKQHLEYEIIGQTLDDAAGEAFDKVARILNLGYPGGPAISAMSEKIKNKPDTKLKEKLPRPMLNSGDYNFSFSGLKTAVLYLAKRNIKLLNDRQFIMELCREFQQAVIDVLIAKTLAAAEKLRPNTIMLAGGVSANVQLRKQLAEKIEETSPQISFSLLPAKYSVDNAAMMASAAGFRWQKFKSNPKIMGVWKNNWHNIKVDANLNIKYPDGH